MRLPTLIKSVVVTVALGAAPAVLLAQYTSPNVVATPGAVVTTLGPTLFVNHGLVGVGRISASKKDGFGETFGSVSGLQVTGWHRNPDGSYAGVFNILPDRGYNAGTFFSDYAARINTVGFSFTPYSGAAGIGGTTTAEKIAAQNQIQFTTPISGVKFRYDDPIGGPNSLTTGLDPGVDFTTSLFGGQALPYVKFYSGPKTPATDCAVAPSDCLPRDIHKLTLDSEALVLRADGSGYIGDEYGGFVYHFDATKKIDGVIVPPDAFVPHFPAAGIPYFGVINTPVNGRRNNQGLEGVALSPDGTRLFALLQSATIQDSNSSQQNRKQTRLLVYDVSGSATPAAPVGEYALTLPTFRLNGKGGTAADLNRTAAQSEIVALDNERVLVLSRDGNGLGHIDPNPSMFKSILLVDTTLGFPTNVAGDAARNVENGKITSAPGVLDASITPLAWAEAVNMLNSAQLAKFNIELDVSGLPSAYQVSKLTLGEKWEGLSLVPANDPNHPNDYFLFVGNDDDFLTSDGVIQGPDGLVSYNGFGGYAAARLPAPVDSPNNESDTLVLAYRVTIITGSGAPLSDATAPVIVPSVAGTQGANGWYTSSVAVTWSVVDVESGVLAQSNCGPVSLPNDTPAVTLTCSATNGAGLSNAVSVTVRIDRTPPSVVVVAPKPAVQTEAGGAYVTYAAPVITETGSGLSASACAPVSGSLFKVGDTTVSCSATDLAGNTGAAAFTVTVTPAPDGKMWGVGHVDQGSKRTHFVFRVAQSGARDHDFARLEVWTNDARGCFSFDGGRYDDRGYTGQFDHNYGREKCRVADRFEATGVASVVFVDDPAFKPAHGQGWKVPTTDTAKFVGAGRLNGSPGYTFEAIATDRGEPGRGRDTFALIIRDPAGKIVVNVGDVIDGGNIQSTRLFWGW